MTKLIWGELDNRLYEAGVDRGVFYPHDGPALVWDGLLSVDELSTSSDVTASYFNGQKYHQKRMPGGFAATIEAFTYPHEFDGRFGFAYRTHIGSSQAGLDHGYKIHLVYNALVAPSSKTYSSLDAVAEAETFSWDISTLPIPIDGGIATSHLFIDTTKAYPWAVTELENILYGTPDNGPSLPSPAEVLNLFETNSILQIVDHGDGTWTAIGPDEVVMMIDETTFEITWSTAVYVDAVSYNLSSL